MSMKKTYGCDICREGREKQELIGVLFKTGKAFELREATATDGVHICFTCAGQLRAKLPSYPLSGGENRG
jgi:hypothetical protein